EAKTSHVVAANLSELELKRILIDKMEANNSINRPDIQRQLYKALVDAYEADKILLDTYGDTVTIKRPRDGADDDQEPFAGTDRGSKRRRSGKEPESTSAPIEKTTTIAGKTTTGTDISKITRKQSKTGKHGHENQKNTTEARNSKPKPEKVNLQSNWSNLGQQKSTHKRQKLKMFQINPPSFKKLPYWSLSLNGP
ncbi:hypothetical protein Tco_1528356, partial [Tanacetum coccineum]